MPGAAGLAQGRDVGLEGGVHGEPHIFPGVYVHCPSCCSGGGSAGGGIRLTNFKLENFRDCFLARSDI